MSSASARLVSSQGYPGGAPTIVSGMEEPRKPARRPFFIERPNLGRQAELSDRNGVPIALPIAPFQPSSCGIGIVLILYRTLLPWWT
jgi:hypothetical protein